MAIDYHILHAPLLKRDSPGLYESSSIMDVLGRNAIGYQMEPWHDVTDTDVMVDRYRRQEKPADSERPFLELPLYDISPGELEKPSESKEPSRVIVIDL